MLIDDNLVARLHGFLADALNFNKLARGCHGLNHDEIALFKLRRSVGLLFLVLEETLGVIFEAQVDKIALLFATFNYALEEHTCSHLF